MTSSLAAGNTAASTSKAKTATRLWSPTKEVIELVMPATSTG
jgi:hypothetical protein